MPIREVRRLVFKLAWAYAKDGMLFPDALRFVWSLMKVSRSVRVVGDGTPDHQLAVAGARTRVELRQDSRGVAVWLVSRKVAVHAGWLPADEADQVIQVWNRGGKVAATAEIAQDIRYHVTLQLTHYRLDADRLAA